MVSSFNEEWLVMIIINNIPDPDGMVSEACHWLDTPQLCRWFSLVLVICALCCLFLGVIIVHLISLFSLMILWITWVAFMRAKTLMCLKANMFYGKTLTWKIYLSPVPVAVTALHTEAVNMLM